MQVLYLITMTEQPSRLVIDFEHNDIQQQKNLMTHLANLLKDFGDTPLTVEVVVYGPAIQFVTTSPATFADHIATLQSRGVKFLACKNAMKRFGIQEDQLLDGVTPIPSGVGALVKKQLDGYVYLKG